MKISIIPLILAFTICSAWPLTEEPELAALWEEKSFIFPEVYSLPDSMVPAGINTIVLAGVEESRDSLTLYLIGTGSDGPDVLASGPFSGDYNFTKSAARWEDSSSVISIYFQMPYSARYTAAEYTWSGDELIPVRWLSGDPSLEALDRVDSLLALGLLEEAGVELCMMFYPGTYYQPLDICSRFLRSAHTHALEEFRNGDPEGAVELFKKVDEAMSCVPIGEWYELFPDRNALLESDISPYMEPGEYITILNDYGFFLEQSGENEKAVEVLENVLLLDPERMVTFLNLADALWSLNSNHEAVINYQIYIEMMESNSLHEQIPYRAEERILNYQ